MIFSASPINCLHYTHQVLGGNEKLGSFPENLAVNMERGALPKSRLDSDWSRLEEIKRKYGIE